MEYCKKGLEWFFGMTAEDKIIKLAEGWQKIAEQNSKIFVQ